MRTNNLDYIFYLAKNKKRMIQEKVINYSHTLNKNKKIILKLVIYFSHPLM